jgi:hypothetical protein
MSQLSRTERASPRACQAVVGLVALADYAFFVVGDEYTFEFDLTTWRWIHLLLGIGVVAVVGAFPY